MNNEPVEILNLNSNNYTNKMSIVETYGEDLTKKEFITDPAIGRDKEINQMILTLLTPEKGCFIDWKSWYR